jgi:hypothetical protein
MNPKFVIGIVGVVFAIVFGGAMTASYHLGRANKEKEYADTAVLASKKASTNLEKIQNETQKMEPAAIDADLAKLGIMRESTDR